MAKYNNNNMSYQDWIKSHSKKQLQDLIIGEGDNPPLTTRDEPKFTRPQLIWAMSKLNKNKIKGFTYTEKDVDEIISLMQGFKWDLFYNYDYVRFDIRKPSLYIFLILIGFGIYGVIFTLISLF